MEGLIRGQLFILPHCSSTLLCHVSARVGIVELYVRNVPLSLWYVLGGPQMALVE